MNGTVETHGGRAGGVVGRKKARGRQKRDSTHLAELCA